MPKLGHTSADEVREEVHTWCHVCASVLSKKTEAEVLGLALGIMKFCREAASRSIQQAARSNFPLMFAYMSDGWSGKVFRRHAVKDEHNRTQVRVTRVRRRYCLQRG